MGIDTQVADNDNCNVWDNTVPIVKVNEELYRVYMLDEIVDPQHYGELVELFNDIDETVTVEWHMNCTGGVLHSTTMLLDMISNSKAKVIGKLSGMVASTATMLTMVFDEVEVSPYVHFMIHNYSSWLQGKGNELKAEQCFVSKEFDKLYKEVYKGFLTPREIKKVLDGADIWMGKDEVEERLTRRKNSTV